MADLAEFSFVPPTCFEDTNAFPNDPGTPAQKRAALMAASYQMQSFINDILIPAINLKAVGTMATPGNIKIHIEALGKDFILQWQTISLASNTQTTLTFNTPFPTDCMGVFGQPEGFCRFASWGKTKTDCKVQQDAATSIVVRVFSIGY